jgi:glycosyltransferase involved in cell wall biosynthesis/ubiquinone/menaquinone biosynthesis C-methylase UbiE
MAEPSIASAALAPPAREAGRYLYVAPRLDGIALFSSDVLDDTTERHRIVLETGDPVAVGDPVEEINRRPEVAGIVIGLTTGLPDRRRLDIISAALRRGQRVWLYWPGEQAVECVDRERLQSLQWHRRAVIALEKVGRRAHRVMKSWERVRPGLRWIYRGAFPVRRYDMLADLERLSLDARPVSFRGLDPPPDASRKIDVGLYLRTDFWAPITSGGSYGHTCYVAKELSAITERFVCLLAQPFKLLDDLGVAQVVMDAPTTIINEDAIVSATTHYYPIVKTACEVLRPSYIYERLCLGNYVAALLSRELQIPYIIEYNGSEISMQRSFDKTAPFYTDVYLKAEELAFRQAALISVISEHVRNDLLSRGVDARKILVNPNGADLDSYAPADAEAKRQLRAELGFTDRDRVIGFTGTFGGWHGIDVLAAAIPRICAADPLAQFLIIGDGTHKPQLDAEVERHGVGARVRRVGRVPQAHGARLLQACDIYVSPHNTHMVDGKFFGSPTKIFEYMAMGGGVVASDLEQIGEVLSPALRVGDLSRSDLTVSDQRSVLCTPGDVDEFVNGVVGLVRRPDLCVALGRNSRQAVAGHYSWHRHVERLWTFAAEMLCDTGMAQVDTGDAYKDQVQRQWNNNPVGSETARSSQPHSLEWFLEVERYRYGTYAPWMPEVMEFAGHAGEQVLEVGGGMGTDLAQFAKHGAIVTDVDLSEGHLQHARENFRLRSLTGRFVHHDAESLPFDDNTFDLVYSNGVIHHTPNTSRAVSEIFRVLKPGGRVIAMVYAENSLQYWRNLVWHYGMKSGDLASRSMAEIMSRSVERTGNDARPLVKVYTKPRLRALFKAFGHIQIVQRQISPELVPRRLRRLLPVVERLAGWNLIIKAMKPSRA